MREINISQVDVLFVNGIYQIEFLFYFKRKLDTKKIRTALQKLSSMFWPMFGEYQNGVFSFEKYREDDFYDEKTVQQEFLFPSTEKEKWEVYSPYSVQNIKKLFALKVIQFKNGMILIPKMSHLAGDGYSYFYFLSSLAILSQHTLLPSKSSLMQLFAKPHHRRTTLKDFFFEGAGWNRPQQDIRFMMENDEVLRKDVDGLIRKVSESRDFRISTNDILSAMALKKLVEAQQEFQGDYVELTMPIDVRRQVKEYGRKFFGNGIMLHRMKLEKKDIDHLPLDELAIQIRQFMPSVTTQSYTEYLTRLEEIISMGKVEKFRPFDPMSGFLVTNISRLPVNRLNFGTGPPEMTYPFTVEKNAAAVLAKDANFILRYAY